MARFVEAYVSCSDKESKAKMDYRETVGRVYIARVQYSSLGEGAASVSLGVVNMEEGVQVRVQVECGREEVGDREIVRVIFFCKFVHL